MGTTVGAPAVEPDSLTEPDGGAGRRSLAQSGAAVRLDAVGHSFGALEAVADVDLDVGGGEVLGLVGPSGCGKSTLLELVAGLREPTRGRASVGGAEAPAERLRRCAYMPQRDLLLPWLTALDNATIALRNRGLGRSEARAAAAPLFGRFGLGGFERARPAELSGGMRQRVAFLRTLLAGKPVLLLDEPFAGLDAITRGEMQEWLADALARASATTLLVTHDVEEALYLCDRVVVLSARPARVVDDLGSPAPRSLPRAEAITAPEFAGLRERALEALQGGLG